ncbi:MAG TPA: cytochrome c [Candidatus Binatia bacterium]|nr:cytochrome c [Candidatus Binatia bacterium]
MIRFVALVVLALVAVVRADDRTADVQRLLDLLAGTQAHYREAFEDGGDELSSEVDLEEARLLMTDACDLNRRLAIVPTAQLDALLRDLDVRTGVATVAERLDAFRTTITARTGIVPATLPQAPPSAARGRVLFQENCALCHGATGAGDGPDTKRLHLTPADFTSVEFMRRETPADFFTMITMGRRKRGMPDWSSLSVQQRWDLIAYVWTLAYGDADRTEGTTLWTERCAACHAHDLATPGRLADRDDRTLFVRLSRAPHLDATTGLTDAQRWRLVAHARALSLGGGAP